jgi:HPt (histidine-containing phosphotransfer) domain-containing protein
MELNVSGATQIFDRAALVHTLMGDEALAEQITRVFVVDANAQLVALGQAVQDGGSPAVRRIGHTMKGAAASVGATALAEAFGQLETAGRDQNLQDAASAVQFTEERLRDLELALRAPRQPQTGTDE